MAWTSDLVPPADRGRAMATYYTAWELGIGGGQVLLGLLFPLGGFTGLFATAAGAALLGALLAIARLGPPARGSVSRPVS
jgi:predicted MFS family arabinose efflux permease